MSDEGRLSRACVSEFEGLDLKDKRRSDRILQLVERLSRDPSRSVRAVARSNSEEEAFYRVIRGPQVTMNALLAPHITHTTARCSGVSTIIVASDTSGFEYEGQGRAGLGRVRTKSSQGFLFHASLAIDAATAQPLGLLASKVWVRPDEPTGVVQGANGPRKKSGSDYAKDENKESDRWDEQAKATEELLAGSGCKLIHVADREADIYSLLASMVERNSHFVIRLARDKKARTTEDDPLESLVTLARRAQGCVEVGIPLTKRPATTIPGKNKTFAEREARIARLEFAATSAEIKAPAYSKSERRSLPINIVHVRELDAPAGQEPVEWLLLTSEPIETAQQVAEVVNAYRMRWLIEEFFKALKTGCSMERREHESLHTLTNVLALCIPIAYQLLAVRHLARTKPDAPAQLVLSPTQIAILQAKTKLPRENPTAYQALEAIAYLGSHFTPLAKKMVGWQVLNRGMMRLLDLEEGWRAREDVIER